MENGFGKECTTVSSTCFLWEKLCKSSSSWLQRVNVASYNNSIDSHNDNNRNNNNNNNESNNVSYSNNSFCVGPDISAHVIPNGDIGGSAIDGDTFSILSETMDEFDHLISEAGNAVERMISIAIFDAASIAGLSGGSFGAKNGDNRRDKRDFQPHEPNDVLPKLDSQSVVGKMALVAEAQALLDMMHEDLQAKASIVKSVLHALQNANGNNTDFRDNLNNRGSNNNYSNGHRNNGIVVDNNPINTNNQTDITDYNNPIINDTKQTDAKPEWSSNLSSMSHSGSDSDVVGFNHELFVLMWEHPMGWDAHRLQMFAGEAAEARRMTHCSYNNNNNNAININNNINASNNNNANNSNDDGRFDARKALVVGGWTPTKVAK